MMKENTEELEDLTDPFTYWREILTMTFIVGFIIGALVAG